MATKLVKPLSCCVQSINELSSIKNGRRPYIYRQNKHLGAFLLYHLNSKIDVVGWSIKHQYPPKHEIKTHSLAGSWHICSLDWIGLFFLPVRLWACAPALIDRWLSDALVCTSVEFRRTCDKSSQLKTWVVKLNSKVLHLPSVIESLATSYEDELVSEQKNGVPDSPQLLD